MKLLTRLAGWLRRQPAAEVWCWECGRLSEDGSGSCAWCTAYLDGCQIADEPEPDRARWP